MGFSSFIPDVVHEKKAINRRRIEIEKFFMNDLYSD
ncbi:hypothetical protein P872_16170 [Rhodonellum psychrophilum GCM71 = DSM 17998]|uniref:Uncharacterized protein n=1 Tax=Rhodonellum psychrophilum GCM71 = DSM 17998 TaxID=1123057 RepID=U5C0R5_9BACT|nr:hypothetical protein P872_16170 [Rhodonellum psychrophilum GCM71 = DSM 17998]